MNPQMRACLILFLIAPIFALPLHAQKVPDTLVYCGIQLHLGPDIKADITEEVKKIQASPKYFQAMLDRAQTYFPYIEAAFFKHKVPMDLKYLAIQESSLRPNAVSSANAVGFWQFKGPTAKEMGLIVNEQLDERRHIYRASEAAAVYLSKANYDFSNWVYAVISYYEGPTGAVPHTNPDYFAVDQMEVDKDLHWYAKKAIAHKIAYEEAFEKMEASPKDFEMVPTKGSNNLNKFIKKHSLEREELLEYNPWIRKYGNLPSQKSFYVFLPTEKKSITLAVRPNPENVQRGDLPSKKSPAAGSNFPQAISRTILSPSQYASFTIEKDLHYGNTFIKYKAESPLAMLAMNAGVSLDKLILWNQLMPKKEPKTGKILYLDKPSKSEYHIVEEGQNLGSIAAFHNKSVDAILKKNRMGKETQQIYIGQKLYLKKKKPKGELMIILVNDKIKEEVTPIESKPPTASVGGSKEVPKESHVEEVETSWTKHVVKEGETLWGISQQYDTKVEIIKMINKLANDNIQPGMELRILAKKKALDKK